MIGWVAASGRLDDGTLTHYGYGFFAGNWYGRRVAYHSGYDGDFSAEDALVLDGGLEIAALADRAAIDLTPLLKSVAAIVDAPLDANLDAALLRRELDAVGQQIPENLLESI